ncbi:MAG: lytic murein transglycosylase [bacterium]|nr:lytic murein transglycosylase [bacterium]
MQSNTRALLTLFIIGFLFASAGNVFAQSACSSDIDGKSRAELERELEACNQEIAEWTATLNRTKQESASFSRDVSALTAKINAAQANIKAKNIAISNLSRDIAVKQSKISILSDRLEQARKAIAHVIRKTNEVNSYSLAEALLSNRDLSEFFVDVDTYASTERAINELMIELRGVKSLTEAEKADLDKKKQAEAAAKAAIEMAKREVEIDQKEKKNLLAASQSKEKTYAQVVAEKQANAAKIRATLFPLRDAGAIPFGTALQYAEAAEAKTGVRAALILAILQQESNLGANVGSCVITDLSTGATKSVNSGRVFANGIHPTRDLPVLQTLVTSLGRDPLSTKVSCPLSIGYGGAMGPAQFIPSTWKIIQPSLSVATGKSMPDPWNPADAIMASALLLRDNGAGAQSYAAERTAACKYYSGRNCSFSPAATYGNQVMAKANTIKLTMIDPLKGY